MNIHGFSFAIQAAPKVSDYELIIGDNVGFGQSIEKEIEVATVFIRRYPRFLLILKYLTLTPEKRLSMPLPI